MKLNYFITLLVTTCFLSPLASADNSLTQRMKARLPEVLALKNSGVVGEGTDGKLLVRKEEGEKLEKLVKEENKDRAALFVILAKKTGGTPDEVAKKFALGMASKAKKGHWFKKPSGNWVSK